MNGVIAKPLMKADPSVEGFAPVSTTGGMTVREYVGWEDLQQALSVEHLEAQWEALLTYDETASLLSDAIVGWWKRKGSSDSPNEPNTTTNKCHP